MIEPGEMRFKILLNIALLFLLIPSIERIFQPITWCYVTSSARRIDGLVTPYGGLKNCGFLPMIFWIEASVFWSSSITRFFLKKSNNGLGLKVWLPTIWPFATIFFRISGCYIMFLPMQKKVASTLYFSRISKIFMVCSVGPSSNVNAIFLSFSVGLLQ